ncbi:MAG: GTP pyrophosphokinase family protein [Clostridiales bacterium]|nr:GTP pyrophosphokinase family protein [Clostridiales bacterium]MBS5878095.1 GTP pyrophosphokinase family protein [Clostridiales bacterium]
MKNEIQLRQNEYSYILKSIQKAVDESDVTPDEFIEFLHANMTIVNQFFANYECAALEVETKFKVLNNQFSIRYDANPIESIKTRVKSYESILKKMDKKGVAPTLEAIEEEINDIAGVRVICSFIEDIYHLADCFLEQDDITLLKYKDYIKDPKENGYRSLHLLVEVPIFLEAGKKIVKVEVQLRTIAMDFWASLEHKLRYKKDLPEDLIDKLTTELTDCAEKSAQLDQRMQNVRSFITFNKE